jgi:hypothetical protein
MSGRRNREVIRSHKLNVLLLSNIAPQVLPIKIVPQG